MHIAPLHDLVVILQDAVDQTTASGIITSTVKEKQGLGTVIAVGPGRILDTGEHLTVQVVPGDRVVFPANAGHPTKLDGVEYKLIREIELYAKLAADPVSA